MEAFVTSCQMSKNDKWNSNACFSASVWMGLQHWFLQVEQQKTDLRSAPICSSGFSFPALHVRLRLACSLMYEKPQECKTSGIGGDLSAASHPDTAQDFLRS